jgi:hypothetical protein
MYICFIVLQVVKIFNIKYSVRRLAGRAFRGVGSFRFSEAALGMACARSGLAPPVQARRPRFV